jgi:hypothetical protein
VVDLSFVNISAVTDPQQLLDDGVDSVNTTLAANGFPGWSAQDATLVVISLAVIFQAVADVANMQTTVAAAIWRAFGTQLLNIPYSNGTRADVLATFTFTTPAPDSVSYFIGAGATVVIDNQFFGTQADYTANMGDTTASILLVASQVGAVYNDLGGVGQTVALYQAIDWVASVVTQGVTSNGSDQEDDATYQGRLVSAAQLQAPRPVVDADWAAFVQSDTVIAETGISVGRATSIDGYYADGRALSSGGTTSPTVLACTLTSGLAKVYYTGTGIQVPEVGAGVTGTGVPGSTTITQSDAGSFTMSANATTSGAESLTVAAMSGYGPKHLTCVGSVVSGSNAATITTAPWPGAIPDIGAHVNGAGIPNGTVIAASPAPTTTGFHLSVNASATGTNETITISSWTQVPLAETTFVTDINGNPLSTQDMDTLLAFAETYRPQNWLIDITAPSYTQIYVTVLVKALPSADPTALEESVQAALLTWLNPQTWGNTQQTENTGPGSWLNSGDGFNIVRYKEAIAESTIPGVAYVDTLFLGTSPSPAGTVDITMAGPAPLPTSTTGTISVTVE